MADYSHISDGLTLEKIKSWDIRCLNKFIEQSGVSPEKHKTIKNQRRREKMKVYRNRNRNKDKEEIIELMMIKQHLTKLVSELKLELYAISFAIIVDEFLDVVESTNFENE